MFFTTAVLVGLLVAFGNGQVPLVNNQNTGLIFSSRSTGNGKPANVGNAPNEPIRADPIMDPVAGFKQELVNVPNGRQGSVPLVNAIGGNMNGNNVAGNTNVGSPSPTSSGGSIINGQQPNGGNAPKEPIRSPTVIDPMVGFKQGVVNTANVPQASVPLTNTNGGNQNGNVAGNTNSGSTGRINGMSSSNPPQRSRNGFLGSQPPGSSVNNNQRQQAGQVPLANNVGSVINNWLQRNQGRTNQPRNNFNGRIQPVYKTNNKISYFQDRNLINSYGLVKKLKLDVLEEHNSVRQDVRSSFMAALRWNETLAAKAWMDVRECRYVNKLNGAVQAMIHEKKTGSSMISEALNRWTDEKNNFNLFEACNQGNTCRYSQLVWATTREVGCARQVCGDMSFISCMYYPVGNIVNTNAYNEGTRCAGCMNSCNTDNLCEWPPANMAQPMQPNFQNPPMMGRPFL